MQQVYHIALVLLAGLLGWAGTLLVEQHAARMGLVQGPNERSSHTKPTPRGGGAAVAVAIAASGALLAVMGEPTMWMTAVLCLAIGLLGFADDLIDLSPAVRFPIQGIVLAVLVWWSSPLPAIPLVPGFALEGWILATIVVIVGLWWLNLYNFMDGIDGIAATQAIIILLGATAIWLMTDTTLPERPPFWLALATAAAATGFLLRNWPPAHIFMGDAGSNSLAVAIFGIAVTTAAADALSYATWLILPSAFVADATVTLVRRLIRGERPWKAHRHHAYQQLSRLWGHRAVTLLYCCLTAFWSTPIALLCELSAHWSWAYVLVAYLPITLFVIFVGAGAASERRNSEI